LKAPADRMKDVHFGGLNLDLFSTDRTFLQGTVLRAWNVTDGFNSVVVMPADPLTGEQAPAPAVLRFTPSRTWATSISARWRSSGRRVRCTGSCQRRACGRIRTGRPRRSAGC
jgi:hypothetical protein